jgi:hypothetical protein
MRITHALGDHAGEGLRVKRPTALVEIVPQARSAAQMIHVNVRAAQAPIVADCVARQAHDEASLEKYQISRETCVWAACHCDVAYME